MRDEHGAQQRLTPCNNRKGRAPSDRAAFARSFTLSLLSSALFGGFGALHDKYNAM